MAVDIVLIISIILLFLMCIYILWFVIDLQIFRKKQRLIPIRIIITIFSCLVLTYLLLNLRNISAHEWMISSLTIGLVLITAIYAWSTAKMAKATKEQADASVQMAKEMAEQSLLMNKPNIVLELIKNTPEKNPVILLKNPGHGSAINTDIFIDYPPFDFNKISYTWAISVGVEKGCDFRTKIPIDNIDTKKNLSSGFVIADYEDIFGNYWHSKLEIRWDEYFKPGHLTVGISGHYKSSRRKISQ